MSESPPDEPAPYDHVRAIDATIPDGTYRIVGMGADDVTLLFVGDVAGNRVHDGRVFTVSRDEYETLSSAPNPDDDGLVRRWGLVVLAGALFAVSLSPAATETLGVSQSLLRSVVVALIALDAFDKLR